MIYFDKQIQERIDHINFQIKYLNGDEEFTEDIKDEDLIIEAFQKNNLEKKIEFYKEAKKLYERALKSIPGGASSSSRTPLEGYSPYPIFIDRAEGSKLYDVDGNEYIDFLLALGPTLTGNANPKIIN